MLKGKFITFEGGECTGKTSIIIELEKALKEKGYKVIVTREPGGIDIAEQIRNIILNPENTKIDKSIVIAGFSFIFFSHLLIFLKDREIIGFILSTTKPLMKLKYFDKKFFINPIAIFIHSFFSLILLNLLDTKIIPFLRKLFYPKMEENDKVKKIKKI